MNVLRNGVPTHYTDIVPKQRAVGYITLYRRFERTSLFSQNGMNYLYGHNTFTRGFAPPTMAPVALYLKYIPADIEPPLASFDERRLYGLLWSKAVELK